MRIKQRVRVHPIFAEIESVGHFAQRYSLYVVLTILGLFVVSHNVLARTIRPDEVGQGAIWGEFAQNEVPELIVETSPARKLASAPVLAVGGAQPTAVVAAVSDTEIVTAVGQNRTADAEMSDVPQARSETVQYTVSGGDTVSTIASRYGLSTRTLLWSNNMSDVDFIKPGQVLKIPPEDGVLYVVKRGDNLNGILSKYKGDVTKTLIANDLAVSEAIQPGMELFIPDGEQPAPPVVAVTPRSIIGSIFSRPTAGNPPPSSPTGAGRFTWPTPGRRINQYFRGNYHTGIDIDGTYSSPIYAAAAGTVTFAAFDRSGYGLHITIAHGNGYQTLYAHASKVFVRPGQQVSRGQTIAMVGSTGRSTGTHLHFEVRAGGRFLNPLSFY